MSKSFVASLLILLTVVSSACKKSTGESASQSESNAVAVAAEVPPKSSTASEPTQANDPSAEAPSAPDDKDKNEVEATIEKPFLFAVSGPNGASGHLFGTMHMGVDAKKELPSFVWDALKKSSALAIEADITDIKVAMGLMLPQGQTLRSVLGEETWALLEEKLGKGPAQMLMPMKPAAAASAIAIHGLKMTTPMDLAIVSQAQDQDMPVHFLEDAEFQLAMLDKVMTAETVREMLTNPDAGDMQTMLKTYRSGDADALIKVMQDDASLGEDGEEKMEALLFERNENWIPKLESLFQGKNAFIAVGAAHLVGPRSVVELLKARGYTVTRVKSAAQ